MDSFSELQKVWQSANHMPPAAASEIISRVRRERKQMVVGVSATIFSLLTTIAMMVWIWLDYDPDLPTTRISLVIVVTAVAGAIIIKSQALRLLLGSVKEDRNNKEMLEALVQLQRKQRRFNSIGMSAYYIMLCTGLALYLAEFVRGNIWFGVAAYGLSFGWIAFAWFYLRKRGIKKQNAKLDGMIEHLRALQSAWNE